MFFQNVFIALCRYFIFMEKEAIIATIRDYMSHQPVIWVGIAGSLARNEMTGNSDVDIVVQFDPAAQISLFDYVRYKQDLEEILKRKVDILTYKYLSERLKPYIERDIQIIYQAA